MAVSLHNIADIYLSLGDIDAARENYSAAAAFCRENGDTKRLETNLHRLRILEATMTPNDEAHEPLFREMLASAETRNDLAGVSEACFRLGTLLAGQSRLDEATVYFRRNLRHEQKMKSLPKIAEILEALAAVIGPGQDDRVPRLYGATSVLRKAIGCPMIAANVFAFEHNCAQARSVLGDAAFAAGWAEGEAMSAEQAVEYALADGVERRQIL